MKDIVKKDNLYEVRQQLDKNFDEYLHKYEQQKWYKSLDIAVLYHGAVILALAFSRERKITDVILGLVFIMFYIIFNVMLINPCFKKHPLFKFIFILQLTIIGVLSYNAFTLLWSFIKMDCENTFKFTVQIAFHSYLTFLFNGLNIHLRRRRAFQIYYLLVWSVNALYFAISTFSKYTDDTDLTVENTILEVTIFVLTTLIIFYIYQNSWYHLNSKKQLSFSADLERYKSKKLEFFLASLENQQIILVQHRLKDVSASSNQQSRKFLDNEFIDNNQRVKESMANMHSIFRKIKFYETDENRKKLIDILENKSSKEEWKNPNMYTFKLKQKFHESLLVNFVGFQDLQVKTVNGEIELDKQSHYYAIQLVQNDRLLLKIIRKFQFLQDFTKTFKGYVKGDDYKIKVISMYEDYCQVIQNELDLYRELTFPKEKMAEIRTDEEAENKQIEYTIKVVERNMTMFFDLYKQYSSNYAKHLMLSDGENIKLTKDVYLVIVHIVINTILIFFDYIQNIKISFSEDQQFIVLKIRLQKLDWVNISEERMYKNFLNIEDSFESLINKKVKDDIENPSHYHSFNYHREKEEGKQDLIYSVYIPKFKKQLQNFNHSFIEPNFNGNQSNYESSNQFKSSKHNPSSDYNETLLQQKEKGKQLPIRQKQKEYTFAGYTNTVSNQTYQYNN